MKLINGILWILFCQQLALMTWFFIHASVVSRPQITDFPAYENIKKPLFSSTSTQSFLNAALLFGSYINKNDSDNGNQVLRSSLNVQLTGIMASNIPRRSIAIISHDGQQQSIQIGDVIQGTKAQVEQILPDRIIINHQQQREVLWLDDETTLKQIQVSTDDMASIHHKIKNNPATLLDYLSISPVKENNYLQGYRLNPGKDPDLFKKLGLQYNDLVIALNGVDLQNEHEAIAVMNELNNLTAINLTVLRDGSHQDIHVDLSQH